MSILTIPIGTCFHLTFGQCDVYDLVDENTIRIQHDFIIDVPIDGFIYISPEVFQRK